MNSSTPDAPAADRSTITTAPDETAQPVTVVIQNKKNGTRATMTGGTSGRAPGHIVIEVNGETAAVGEGRALSEVSALVDSVERVRSANGVRKRR